MAVASCAEQRVAGPPPSQSTAGVLPPVAPPESTAIACEAAPPPPPPKLEKTWQEAVRVESWSEAKRLLDALPEAELARPEIKYVRARVALALHDEAAAASLLDGLETSLPDLASDVARYRAEAELVAGPFAPAAEYFAKSGKARDLAKAAQALARAGQFDKARATADRAVLAAQKTRSRRDEAAARVARAKIRREKFGDAAAEPDLRWVAVHAPHTPEGRDAIATLDKVKHPLTPKERMQVVDALLDVASPDAADEIVKATKGQPETPQQLHTRAMALFKARSYGEAAKTFELAADKHAGSAPEDLYYAGRALARAGKADEAQKRLEVVKAKVRASPYHEKAAYLAARLALDAGRYDDAVKAYASYLRNFTKSERRDEAEYEHALAELSSSDPKAARRSLRELWHRARGDEINKLKELEGVAAIRAGQRDDAVALWTEVATSQPLSWAAQAARARLAKADAVLPPLLDPPQGGTPPPIDPKLPSAVALLASVGLDGDAEALLASKERDAMSGYGDRSWEALCSMYGKLARGKRRYRVAATAVNAQVLRRAPSYAERWMWECLYPQPFAARVRALEEENALPHGLVHAVMRQESGFDPAIVSPAAAVGLMQLMPGTAKQCAGDMSADVETEDLTSPEVNLRLGAFYLGKLMKIFAGNVLYVAAAYNAGPKAVASWVGGKDNDADLWVARIPYDETRRYVAKVAANLARYEYLQGGEAAVAPLVLELPPATVPEDAY
ncbi:MAG TPA: transglycosylase SLT domain-containing protein [Minicystis sp.]|nr:transglycosylase SLT domain-containing protein [Minicystis sp.]